MNKTILALVVILCSYVSTFGQSYAKINVPLAILGAFNPSVESKINEKWTFECDVLMTFRNETNNRGPFRIFMLQPEARYYFKESNNGFFLGINTGYAMFRMTKPNWWGDNYDERHAYHIGWSIQAGVTIGYELKFRDRWLVDIFCGGGRQWSMYEAFTYPNLERRTKVNGSAEYMPYKGGINIGYKIGK